MFINDITDGIQSKCKIFADDTKLYNYASNHRTLQNDLHSIQQWSQKWDLHFNVSKCKTIHFGAQNPEHQYNLDPSSHVTIPTGSEEKDLGVIFDQTLNFDKHINEKVGKANCVLSIIKRNFKNPDPNTFVKMYKTMVRPHVEYCNSVWSPLYKRQKLKIERVQRRATKMIHKIKDLPYLERLRYLRLPSLKYRRLRGDLIQCFKIVKGFDNIDIKSLIFKNRSNRGHPYTLTVLCRRSQLRSNVFSHRIVNAWNNLPSFIVMSNTVDQFKSLLDHELKDIIYDFD